MVRYSASGINEMRQKEIGVVVFGGGTKKGDTRINLSLIESPSETWLG